MKHQLTAIELSFPEESSHTLHNHICCTPPVFAACWDERSCNIDTVAHDINVYQCYDPYYQC